ncbi:MAG: hypothetical protein DRZ90_10920 [Spirochaetes bacterium]|nr:MAG: hypothetical protein DRP60_06040 [Spirochaetota bacterium]RKX95039.1 MAG: hypothetical protein DRZ90_10920 [Spirochaetota bacterium]
MKLLKRRFHSNDKLDNFLPQCYFPEAERRITGIQKCLQGRFSFLRCASWKQYLITDVFPPSPIKAAEEYLSGKSIS